MGQDRIRIADVITTKYSDFLSYCDASGKVFISELTNVDFVAFRTSSGQAREYVKKIRKQLDNPDIIADKLPEDDAPISQKDDAISCEEIPDIEPPVTVMAEADCIISESGTVYGPLDDSLETDVLIEIDGDQPDASVDVSDTTIDEIVNVDADVAESSESEVTAPTVPLTSPAVVSDNSGDSLAYLFGVNASAFAEVSLDLLNLGVRSTNCLRTAQCKTIADILSKSVDDLRAIRNMGEKSVNEVVQKVKNYVSDPSNVDTYTQPKSTIHISERGKEPLDPKFKAAVEAFLMGDKYWTEDLSDEQVEQFAKLKIAAETIGEDICLEAYLNPAYGIQICNMLLNFAAPYIQFRRVMEEAIRRVGLLNEFMKKRKAVPFIRAYSVKAGESLSYLLPECSEETTISHIPFLYEKLRQKENMLMLATETNKFLGWLNFDVNKLIGSISENIRTILTSRSERSIEVFTLREEGKTLEEVGTRYGVTRERIRQIELKVFRTFWRVYSEQKYDLIMLVYALRDGDTILHLEELQSTIGNFASVLWACIKHDPEQGSYYYSKTLDAIVVRTDDAANMSESVLVSKIGDLLTSLPEVIEVKQKNSMLGGLAEKNSVPLEILENVFDGIYQQSGIFYHKGRLTVVFMCEYVLEHRFPAGYKIADDFEAARFKQYMVEFFGDKAANITNRAIDAKIGEIGVLCDRGKYIHLDFMRVEQKIIDAVNDYVESSTRSLLPYGEIYEALKETFEGTQITNRYLLQGALKKYGCKFSTGRDFVRKTQSVSFVDELETFIEKRGIVHKSEIFAEFTSLGEAGLGQVVSRSANVFNIDSGYYIHASQFDIQPEDYTLLRKYLTEACRDIPVNIRSVHEDVTIKFPEFMYRNDFEDRNKLFAALTYMFRGEFNFSRPYIARLGVSDITNRSVILQHIEGYDSIEIEELIDICDENSINYVTSSYLCQSLAPDYVRISRTTLMRRELAGITDEIIVKAVEIVTDMLSARDYIVGSKINDFLWFPQIDLDWNEFLLESLIVQSGKVNIVSLMGDPLKHPNAVYVSDEYKNDTFDSLLLKILTDEVHKGSFTSKVEMREWLKEEGFIEEKLPNFLESAKYFFVDETGVHCASEQQ